MASLLFLGESGCCPSEPVSDLATHPRSSDELWLTASCDLPERLDEIVEQSRERGVVPVHGGAAYRWEFECAGSILRVTVETVGPTADGDPVLWLGAHGDPPALVPIRLDAGTGQADLERLLADPERPDPQVLAIDLTTGVVWRI